MKLEDFGPLMDEFFAESEEHVVALRRAMLYLDENDRESPLAAEQLRSVLRSLHTLKGLAGMVGFGEAELLAHGLEEWVRRVSSGESIPARVSLDRMFDGIGLLERVLAARRSGAAPLDVGEFVADPATEDAAPDRPPAVNPQEGVTVAGLDLTAAERYRLLSAIERNAHFLSFEFIPSAELVDRGVGVEGVRTRLSAVGEIIHAAPRVLPGRGVAFAFLVALPAGTEPPAEWSDDGLQWTPLDTASLVPPPAAAVAADRAPRPDLAEQLTPAKSVVRVELGRLDELMRLIGELVLSRARLSDVVEQATRNRGRVDVDLLDQLNTTIERQLRDLRNGVMRVRLVPIGEVFERMHFVVRDLANQSGERVRVETSGRDTEIDKLVVERMMEPMLHLVRNAVSHGVEPKAEREAAGKPPEGVIRLSARAAGDRITIAIEDDGRGIDRAKVARRARAAGLAVDEPLDDEALLDLLCTSGFSTSDQADLASGRGIGMAVARSTTRALGGELFLESEQGRGTRFTIELPLTLMIVDALLVRLADQILAVPQLALIEILQVAEGEIVPFENNEVIRYRGEVLSIVRLGNLFGMANEAPSGFLTILVIDTRARPVGLAVDGVVGLREIVVRPLPDPLVSVPGVSGATELGDGRVSLILDPAELIHLARDQRANLQRIAGSPRV